MQLLEQALHGGLGFLGSDGIVHAGADASKPCGSAVRKGQNLAATARHPRAKFEP